jgi:hypothetical protein
VRVIAAVILWVVAVSGTVLAAEDPREVEGRAAFVRGDYDEALAVFSKLFAEKGDPVFLRNVGRCHQMLRKPDRAIDAFREYLRREHGLSQEERKEVEGFIHDMEALRAEQASHVEPAAAATVPARPAPATEPIHAEPPKLAAVAFAPLTERNPDVAGSGSSPLTRRWWFRTAIGVAAAAGLATALAVTSQGADGRPACPMKAACPLD